MARLFTPGTSTVITRTFNANETFVMPVGVTNLLTVSGRGAQGNPAEYIEGDDYYDVWISTSTTYDSPAWGTDSSTPSAFSHRVYTSASAGPDHCDNTYTSVTHKTETTCYTYFYGNTGDTYIPPTTGASSTGFGKTFPGGTGGAATTTSFTNVTVVAGTSYPVVISVPGGFATITYNA